VSRAAGAARLPPLLPLLANTDGVPECCTAAAAAAAAVFAPSAARAAASSSLSGVRAAASLKKASAFLTPSRSSCSCLGRTPKQALAADDATYAPSSGAVSRAAPDRGTCGSATPAANVSSSAC
jgi:hypothetical protein